MFPMEFYFPQIGQILAGFVFAGLGRAMALCVCGKRNIMRMFTHFAKNGEIRLAK